MLSGARGLLRVVVNLESVFVNLHTPVTRASYFRRRCARRRALLKTTRYVLTLTPRHRTVARHCTAISLRLGSQVSAEARHRGEADGPHGRPQPKPLGSHADPSATHAVPSRS